MSAILTSEVAAGDVTIVPEPTPVHKEPLKLSGALDQYKSFEVTPVIGREYPEANLKEWLESPDSDALLRDLAITSMSQFPDCISFCKLMKHSLAPRCSLFPQTRRPDQRPSKTTHPKNRRTLRQTSNIQTTHPPSRQQRPNFRRQR